MITASSKRYKIERKSLASWQEHLRLGNGRELILRPISPLDAEPMRAGFQALSPEEIRLRFMHPMTELTVEFSRQLTHLDPNRAFAFVATEPLPPGVALVGAVARLSFDRTTGIAEFALLVAKPLAGMGLGSYLLRKLIHWAKRNRMNAIYGDVLRENTAMVNIADQLGFEHRSVAGEQGIVRVWLNLAPKMAKTG